MKDKFMSLNGKQVVVISSNDNWATVMSFPKNDNMVQAFMETVPVDQLKPYNCIYANDTDPARFYCNARICEYPIGIGSVSQAMSACDRCLIKSLEVEEIMEMDVKAKAMNYSY